MYLLTLSQNYMTQPAYSTMFILPINNLWLINSMLDPTQAIVSLRGSFQPQNIIIVSI